MINSRPQKRLNHIWRRRQCDVCRAIFTTTETPEVRQAVRFQALVGLEAFSRDSLFLSLHESLRHRPSAISDATDLTDTVVSQLMPFLKNGVVTREQVCVVTTQALEHFDSAAVTHYRAFHPI